MVQFFRRLTSHALDINRWRYFARCVMGFGAAARWNCPNCGAGRASVLQRKHLVTRLMRCDRCKLLFRAPTDPPDFGKSFYQEDYQQGFTTDCPSDANLAPMLERSFKGTPKDFSAKIDLLRQLGLQPGARILDFGASWGYGTWQFCQAGFQAIGFEPSCPRARYAKEKLSVTVLHEESELAAEATSKPFDAIFSSHVLEHVPQPSETIEKSKSWLKPGGFFVAFTPNGSTPYQEANPEGYRNHWGMVHPNYLDLQFYQLAFQDWPIYLTGTPIDFDRLATWDRSSQMVDRLESWELLVIAKRP